MTKAAPTLILLLSLPFTSLAAAQSASSAPLDINVRPPGDSRFGYGLRAQLALAEKLIELGEVERGERHLRAVEQAAANMADGLLYKSGKRVDDATMKKARNERGYIFGVRRSGNTGKSWVLSALARYYSSQGNVDRAKELIRQIPSDFEQLRAAQQLVEYNVQTGRLEEAAQYRAQVLAEMKWDPREIDSWSNLRANRKYRFASQTAYKMLQAYVDGGKTEEADRVAGELRSWLDVLNAADRNPDTGEYRQLASTLVRYYIDSDRKPIAEDIAAACVKKWKVADVPDGKEIFRPSLEYNRPKQLALFDLLIKQPPKADFPLTNANLSRLPEQIPTRFVEIEVLETTDAEEARVAYLQLGNEINQDPNRCKRYLQPVIDALVRLGDEPSTIELARELQENLPQQKIQGCPVKAFQTYALRYMDNLNLERLLPSIETQEQKLTSLDRLRISGVATARAYVAAGDKAAARRLLDKCSDAATSEDYSMIRAVIALRHEAFLEVRADEVRRLIEYAQHEKDSRRWTWQRALLAGAARLLVQVERYDWAEQVIDHLTSDNRIAQAE